MIATIAVEKNIKAGKAGHNSHRRLAIPASTGGKMKKAASTPINIVIIGAPVSGAPLLRATGIVINPAIEPPMPPISQVLLSQGGAFESSALCWLAVSGLIGEWNPRNSSYSARA